jgi:type II secretory pathway pseudopilin PulG
MGPVGPLWENLGYLKRQQAELLRYTTRWTEVARLPVEEQPEPLRQRQAESADLMILTALMAPAMTKMDDSCRRSHAQARCAVAALAAERYRRANGRWPESLDALAEAGLLVAVPADPYDGAPLRLARRDDGLVIYAVGPDGHDDGGHIDRSRPTAKGTDLGFRLWDVDRRRQPPLPPRPVADPPPP